MKTTDARSLDPKAQEALRLRVVKAVSNGLKQTEAVQIFDVSRAAIIKWMRQWRQTGKRGLRARQRGRPPKKRLAPRQAATIVGLIIEKTPDQLKLPFALWTRAAVQQLIVRQCDIRLSVWTVGRYLKSWGLTPQKPLRRAYEQDPQAVRRWVKAVYPSIKRQAAAAGAEIYWGDEMGLRSDHQTGRSYGLRGQTPVIPGTGQRFGCNMISAITNRGAVRFIVFKERFTSALFLEFLKRLIKDVRRPIFLIVDRHRVHRAVAVKQWLQNNGKRIRVFYLPTYSPELNPDELLNNDVKGNAFRVRRPATQAEMIHRVRGYLHKRQKMPSVIQSFFHKSSVCYAAD
jgi:transposase